MQMDSLQIKVAICILQIETEANCDLSKFIEICQKIINKKKRSSGLKKEDIL